MSFEFSMIMQGRGHLLEPVEDTEEVDESK